MDAAARAARGAVIRWVAACAIALAATTAVAWPTIVPPYPTNFTPITVYYNGASGCPEYPYASRVTRSDGVIEVTLFFKGPCIAAVVVHWRYAVPIGALEPGDYELRTRYEDLPQYASTTIRVGDATLGIEPAGAPASPSGCFSVRGLSLPHYSYLQIGSARFLFSQGFGGWIGEAPSPGLYDVSLYSRDDELLLTARNAFTVTPSSACNTYDPALWEELLVPVFYNGSSHSGTWQSELSVVSTGDPVPMKTPWGTVNVTTTVLDVTAAFANHPNGAILRAPRTAAERLQFDLRIRDHARALPVRVPVVRERELMAGASAIRNIPGGAGRRATLRLYTNEEELTDFLITSSTTYDAPNIKVKPIRYRKTEPRVATVDLTPYIATRPLSDIRIDPDRIGLRYWALLSVSDGETHELTVLTPMPAEEFVTR